MARRAVERASDETKSFWETRQACYRRTGLTEALGEGRQTIKYEEVYLRAYESVAEARSSHRSLDGATPDQAYFTKLPLREVA
jgi:hypothetical protein